MPMYKLPLALLPSLAYAADASVRQDAKNKLVHDEREYVGAWLATTRNLWRMLGGAAVIQTLPASQETLMGCDGLVVFQGKDILGNECYKFAYFEAKRLHSGFDKLQPRSSAAFSEYGIAAPNYSHFSDQIGRQSQWLKKGHGSDVIFELFVNLEELAMCKKSPFDLYGSTCVLHEYARSYVLPPIGTLPVTNKWKVKDVKSIAAHGSSVADLFDAIINCQEGKLYPVRQTPPGYSCSLAKGWFPENQSGLLEQLAHLNIRWAAYFFGGFPRRVKLPLRD